MTYKSLEAPHADLSGQVILITGGNTGLGKESALQLAAMGPAKVIVTSRNTDRGAAAVRELQTAYPNVKFQLEQLDLGSLKSVKALSQRLLKSEPKLNVLMCNAGTGANIGKPAKTEDGFDDLFQCNNLGHILLIRNLTPLLKKTATPRDPARIICLSSLAHRFVFSWDLGQCNNPSGVSGEAFYGPTKLMSVLTASAFAQELAKDNIVAHSLHPGTVKTEFADKYKNSPIAYAFPVIYALFNRGIKAGTATQVYVASAPEAAKTTGQYWSSMRAVPPSPLARNKQEALDFLHMCDEYVKDFRV